MAGLGKTLRKLRVSRGLTQAELAEPKYTHAYISTIEALYDRYLIKIVVESRHRRRHTAMLTDIGEYAAKEIQREFLSAPPKTPHGISEDAARFIVEVVG